MLAVAAMACDTDASTPSSPPATRQVAAASTPASVGFAAGGPTGGFPESANSLEGAVPPAPAGFEEPEGEPSDGRFVPPLASWTALMDGFGEARRDGLIHGGLDFGLVGRASSVVRAVCAGTVTEARSDDSYGLHVVIDCGDGWTTLYGFLGSAGVEVGQRVARGATVATSDSTGGHLHLQLAYKGVAVNPEAYIDFGIAPRPTPTPLPATAAAATAPAATVQPPTATVAATAIPATSTSPATATKGPPQATATPGRTPTPTATRRPPTPSPTPPPVFNP